MTQAKRTSGTTAELAAMKADYKKLDAYFRSMSNERNRLKASNAKLLETLRDLMSEIPTKGLNEGLADHTVEVLEKSRAAIGEAEAA